MGLQGRADVLVLLDVSHLCTELFPWALRAVRCGALQPRSCSAAWVHGSGISALSFCRLVLLLTRAQHFQTSTAVCCAAHLSPRRAAQPPQRAPPGVQLQLWLSAPWRRWVLQAELQAVQLLQSQEHFGYSRDPSSTACTVSTPKAT